jgi:hypothetical protein
MMMKLKWLVVLLTPIMLSWGAQAQQLLEPANQLRGHAEQWTSGVRLSKAGGETYPLSEKIQVIDQKAVLLSKTAVRASPPVQLLIADGLVTLVVASPGIGPVIEQARG